MSEREQSAWGQIHGSISNLQLSFLLANIQATYFVPQQAGDALLSSLKKTQKTLDGQKIEDGNLEPLTERVCHFIGNQRVGICEIVFNQCGILLVMVIVSDGRLYPGAPKLNKRVYSQKSKEHQYSVRDRIIFHQMANMHSGYKNSSVLEIV